MPEVVEFQPPETGTFVMTPTAEAVVSLLDYCQRFGQLGLVCGDAGVGKTTAINHYIETHSHARALRMRFQESRGFGAALTTICDGLGLSVYGRDYLWERANRLQEWLIDWWNGIDADRPLLVIDESQFLGDQCIDFLRCCWDDARVGMVFSGNTQLRKSFVRGQKSALAPFASRLGPRLNLGPPGPADVAAICRARGVQGAREVAFLQRHAENGGLRLIDTVISTAARRSPDQPIRLPELDVAAQFLGL